MVTDTTSAWTTGWYVMNADTTISDRIEVTGNVSLILTDGATLTASAGIHVPETASLDICGQSAGTGKLIANASDGNAAIGGKGGEKETTGTISVCLWYSMGARTKATTRARTTQNTPNRVRFFTT